ncbi:MAG: DUF4097 family beta strand repeat-containing protein [Thermoanaerobaculia bacterium]
MTQTLRRAPWGALTLLLLAAPVSARGGDDCNGWRDREGDHRYCETRELTVDGLPGLLSVDARRNGGISVLAWDRDEIAVEARISAWDRHEDDARSVVAAVEIELGPTIRAHGPDEDSWSVSYRIHVPRDTNLDLRAHNGGLSVTGIRGDLRLDTENGGISLDAVAGDVEARTTNGGVDVDLVGSSWEGSRLDVETRNGGVDLSVPDGYSAELEVGTVNGRVEIDFPVTVQGRLDRNIRTTLGAGGELVRVVTTNGGVRVRRR